MSELTSIAEELGLDDAAAAATATIEAALQPFTQGERDAFWNAIGLYYATRRHPGADEASAEAA